MAIHITSWDCPALRGISVGYLMKEQSDCGRIHGPIRAQFMVGGRSSYGEMHERARKYWRERFQSRAVDSTWQMSYGQPGGGMILLY